MPLFPLENQAWRLTAGISVLGRARLKDTIPYVEEQPRLFSESPGCTAVSPAFRRWKQEDGEVKVTLSHIESSRVTSTAVSGHRICGALERGRGRRVDQFPFPPLW